MAAFITILVLPTRPVQANGIGGKKVSCHCPGRERRYRYASVLMEKSSELHAPATSPSGKRAGANEYKAG